MNEQVASQTQDWYRSYYAKKGTDRNDTLSNPGVALQRLAAWLALIRALALAGYRPRQDRVLDVGGGSGGSLVDFLCVGARANLLSCVDIQEDRIRAGQDALPGIDFQCVDATKLPYPDGAFDIVFSSTMFVQITDDTAAAMIASEMLRVVRPGGHIIIRDWSFPKPGDQAYWPVTLRRIRRLFVGSNAALRATIPAALVPPVGRLLSAHLSWAYFLVRAVFPFLTGMKVYVISVSEKSGNYTG